MSGSIRSFYRNRIQVFSSGTVFVWIEDQIVGQLTMSRKTMSHTQAVDQGYLRLQNRRGTLGAGLL